VTKWLIFPNPVTYVVTPNENVNVITIYLTCISTIYILDPCRNQWQSEKNKKQMCFEVDVIIAI